MAFDTATRNRLSQFVGDARELLSDEFTDQFQVAYGMDPDTGEVADLERLSHLDDAQRQTAIILRETLAHYYANLPTQQKDQAKDYQPLIQRIVREQAFTILNRLCAIRMAEARDLVIESIGAGVQSKGFQLYQHVCGNSLGETGAAYQQYLLSLFDEFGVDLPVLFDRYSPQGRLFPRETVLTELIGMINDPEINPLWAEDETIGWIYQYFNSKEERKAMRDASQAPRNSRELAVRNQFFTPRYVVEFLTDNTLGRIWYEMRKGETGLKESCQYLVRRPNEIFLAEGEEAPETDSEDQEKDLTQEELLNQPVHIPHRPLKDPREIRMLDPACGSMHFGLYAFDLYLKIYEEFWDLTTADPAVGIESTDLPLLTETYESREAFVRDIPRLIIEHNIHGIDIDPRAVQIAGLSLWLRAQRAWKSQDIAAGDRPQVTRSNIVCAEPMPGDQDQLDAFCKTLHPAIAQMVTAIFEEMKLAGEAGSLLKIEEEISSLVARAKEQWQQQPKEVQQELFGGPSKPVEQQREFDLSGITDQQFFEQAEETIYEALRKYASETSEGGFRRKLFAGDAEKGFAFIELCQKRYDAVLMNPPFGKVSKPSEKLFRKTYPDNWKDIYAAFVKRAAQQLASGGACGCITSSQFLYTKQLEPLRETLIDGKLLSLFVQLGLGVLDDAAVDTALSILKKGQTSAVVSYSDLADVDLDQKPNQLLSRSSADFGFVEFDLATFRYLRTSPFAFHTDPNLLANWRSTSGRLSPDVGDVATGNHTFDDFRYLRLRTEVDDHDEDTWVGYEKGGEYSPFLCPTALVANWRNDGAEMRATNLGRHGSDAQVMQSSKYWFNFSLCYSHVSSVAFGPRLLPKTSIFSSESISIFLEKPELKVALLGLLNSTIVQEAVWAFGRYRKIENRAVSGLPIDESMILHSREELEELTTRAIRLVHELETLDETSAYFRSPEPVVLQKIANTKRSSIASQLREICDEIDVLAKAIFDPEDKVAVSHAKPRSELVSQYCDRASSKNVDLAFDLVSFFVGVAMGRWSLEAIGQSPKEITSPDFFEQLPSLSETVASAEKTDKLWICDSGPFASNRSLSSLVHECFSRVFDDPEELENETTSTLKSSTVGEYIDAPGKFFDSHLRKYSESRRSAPIYWPISTESGSYTLWFYYHRLTDQTLYLAVNDFVDPKLKQTNRQLADLRAIQDRTGAQEKELAQLTELESELEQFKADLLEIAAFWKPNLNDGVQITAAPLWKFFRLKKWRDKLKKTWSELESGKYDWAHLALSIWPERVVKEKCTTDRSIAIAHDLEEQLWHEVEVKGPRNTTKTEWQPRDLSESELDAIVDAVKSGKHVHESDSTEKKEEAAAAGH